MAVFIDKCAVCQETITRETPFVSTSGCVFSESHYLFRYCDTGFHQKCIVNWQHRIEYSRAYCNISGGYVLEEEDKWILGCGPFIYGAYGVVSLPYYAEIRLREYPIRLYSPFKEWSEFICQSQWKKGYIEEINDYIDLISSDFPVSVDQLKDLLFPKIIATIEKSSNYRERYIAILSLNLFGEIVRTAESVLKHALNDDHGSVRHAAYMLLKKLKNEEI